MTLQHTKKISLLAILFFAVAVPGLTGSISCHQHELPVAEKFPELPHTAAASVTAGAGGGILRASVFPDVLSPPAASAEPTQREAKHHQLSRSYLPIIHKAADEFEIDPALIKAVIMAESHYNPRAVSKRGARGLMQLMPATAQSLGVSDIFDPQDNIYAGARYLKTLLNKFDGDIRLALAAYNAGSRQVKKYGGVPPFKQTRSYIRKVFKYHQLFKEDA